jgi:integrase
VPGSAYTKGTYARAVARAVEKANEAEAAAAKIEKRERLPISHWSPNRLRHSAATEIRQRFGIEAAQVTLGHAKADVTQVYAERDYALAEQVAAKIG